MLLHGPIKLVREREEWPTSFLYERDEKASEHFLDWITHLSAFTFKQ